MLAMYSRFAGGRFPKEIQAKSGLATEAARVLLRLGVARENSFERIGEEIVLMIMIKIMKKRKKSAGNVEAASSVPVQSAPSAIVQPGCTKPAPPQPAGVAIELVEPAARQVFVAGSFNDWKPETTPLVRLGNGRWKGALSLGPGRHEYLFVVDGQWRPDPNARESVENPFGGRNSVITVSE